MLPAARREIHCVPFILVWFLCTHSSGYDHTEIMANNSSPLQKARALEIPKVLDTTQGETENYDFWDSHADLLREAWKDWESSVSLPALDVNNIVEPDATWERIAPDVYHCKRFVSSHGTRTLQRFIDAVINDSGIPRRRPNGMNRFGGVFHPADGVDGAVALESWNHFYKDLMDTYVLPLGRKYFSSYIRSAKDDAESYAFTIRYKAGEDLQLKEHTDASMYTININLNPDETSYSGSSVYFVSGDDGESTTVDFAPGSAVLHRGQIRHGSNVLSEGERQNLVIWVFGEHGYVRIRPYDDEPGPDQVTFGSLDEL